MYFARFTAKKEGPVRWQLLREHVEHVAALTARFAAPLGLAETGRLAGWLHDMGKATGAFQTYLEKCVNDPDHPPAKGSSPHSPSGALYAHERWLDGGEDKRMTAQMIALCVLSHHEGLCDCLNPDGASPYLDKIGRAERALRDEAAANFFRECEREEALDALFEKACAEVRALNQRIERRCAGKTYFMRGLAARFLLSCLVDADRWDSACFEEKRDPLAEDAPFDFAEAARRLEERLSKFGEPKSDVARVRREVSDFCLNAGANPPGIYTLTVPTGGGKTFSSLRYALRHAHSRDLRRIFYVIPFNTILDQNAREIQSALDMEGAVLEHYGNVVLDRGDGKNGANEAEAWTAHQRLTERWDSPIILASMVHFLDSLYQGGNTATRRMKSLAGSVLIFDEVQAIPFHCLSLFKLALTFLTEMLGCSVLLCTATQPLLDRPPCGLSTKGELVDDVGGLFKRMKRVTLVDEVHYPPMRVRELIDFVSGLQEEHHGVLVILNTKSVARAVFDGLGGILDEDARFLLTTNLCAEHRRNVLKAVEDRLILTRSRGLPCILVSTSLIEAGIDISFPCAVRALCGLDSAVQAAGRCNRGGEEAMGYTYFVNVEENLSRLPEIRKGQDNVKHVLEQAHYFQQIDLISPEAIRFYFEKCIYESAADGTQDYPVEVGISIRGTSTKKDNAVNLLGANSNCKNAWGGALPMPLIQSFRTVGGQFQVIDQARQAVLAPYGDKGKDLVAELAGALEVKARKGALRRAQRYAVNLFTWEFEELLNQEGIYPLGDSGAYALQSQYYDELTGFTREPGKMETQTV